MAFQLNRLNGDGSVPLEGSEVSFCLDRGLFWGSFKGADPRFSLDSPLLICWLIFHSLSLFFFSPAVYRPTTLAIAFIARTKSAVHAGGRPKWVSTFEEAGFYCCNSSNAWISISSVILNLTLGCIIVNWGKH